MSYPRFQRALREQVRRAQAEHQALYNMLRQAMSVEQAKQVLGFEPTMQPSPEEITRAYKNLAFKNHPDRGGDRAKMVEINVAKDILEGKRVDRDVGSPSSRPSTTPPPTRKYEPPKEHTVTWEDAAAQAHVPTSGVSWKFRTVPAYSKTYNPKTSGYVVYGRDDTHHVFVAVENYSYQAQNLGDRNVIENIYHMQVQRFPLSQKLRDLAPRVIRDLFSKFTFGAKTYGAKVEIFPDSPTQFTERHIYYSHGKKLAFKDALAVMGEIGDDDPWVRDRKITVELHVGKRYPNPQYKQEKPGGKYEPSELLSMTLSVNGKEYKLKPETEHDGRWLAESLFPGGYIYGGEKKVVTRAKFGKAFLLYIANDSSEPQELKDACKKAAESMK